MSSVIAAVSGVELLEQAVITLITGEVIESASGPAAQLAKAKAILAVAQGLIQINSGSANGLAGLQTAFLALTASLKNEAVVLAMNGIFAALLTKIQTYEASGSLLGKVGGVIANDFLGYVASAAQVYVNKLTP